MGAGLYVWRRPYPNSGSLNPSITPIATRAVNTTRVTRKPTVRAREKPQPNLNPSLIVNPTKSCSTPFDSTLLQSIHFHPQGRHHCRSPCRVGHSVPGRSLARLAGRLSDLPEHPQRIPFQLRQQVAGVLLSGGDDLLGLITRRGKDRLGLRLRGSQ